jgi:hypothetical protein
MLLTFILSKTNFMAFTMSSSFYNNAIFDNRIEKNVYVLQNLLPRDKNERK